MPVIHKQKELGRVEYEGRHHKSADDQTRVNSSAGSPAKSWSKRIATNRSTAKVRVSQALTVSHALDIGVFKVMQIIGKRETYFS